MVGRAASASFLCGFWATTSSEAPLKKLKPNGKLLKIPGRYEPPLCSHAEMSMRNTSKCACVIQEVFQTYVLNLNKRFFFYKFFDLVA